MSKSMAQELAPRGITVNVVAPGYIQSPMTDALADEVKNEIIKKVPLKRIGKASEVAHACTFLASEEASYITGQTIHVNGGMAMY